MTALVSSSLTTSRASSTRDRWPCAARHPRTNARACETLEATGWNLASWTHLLFDDTTQLLEKGPALRGGLGITAGSRRSNETRFHGHQPGAPESRRAARKQLYPDPQVACGRPLHVHRPAANRSSVIGACKLLGTLSNHGRAKPSESSLHRRRGNGCGHCVP